MNTQRIGTKKDTDVFDLFHKHWALVTAGKPEHFNSCTIGWGSLGTLWTRPGKSGSVVTVYVYPTRYTCELLLENEAFTVSFFPEDYRKSLWYMGSHSGRDGDKAAAAGLTPVPMGESVTYAEANLTFLCRKIYQHQMTKKDIAQDVQEYYQADPATYPPGEDGEWQTHWVFIGEVLETDDRR